MPPPSSAKLVVGLESAASHLLFVAPAGKSLPADLPERRRWLAVMKRRNLKIAELAKTPLALDFEDGGRAALVMVDAGTSRFERLTSLRKAATLLLDEAPETLAIVPLSTPADLVADAVYVVLVNATPLPARKNEPVRALKTLAVVTADLTAADLQPARKLAEANLLARRLTALAPNELTPAAYRRQVRDMAGQRGWRIEEFDYRRLHKMGAGAFCAVAQGSDHRDAAIVHLAYRPRKPVRHVALVGKGICFDTGGHNLKPARHMAGMHEDMAGSAVALAALQAIEDLRLPIAVDVWLAIAHNHVSPTAYLQGDIVTALDGTSIEVVHTDAEGRMVLADTLVLAARGKPDLIIDFATLTGSMVTALGTRQSGVFASDDKLAGLAVAAGRQSGERVCAFPAPEDYDAALESKVADVKQCTLDGEADHILATRFLRHFAGAGPWLHVDLSAVCHEGGLGAVASRVTGFGVAWCVGMLEAWCRP